MRIITSYAYTLEVETVDEAASRFQIYRDVMNDWLRDQGIRDPRVDLPADTYIELSRRDVSHEGEEIDGFLLKKPVLESSHLLHTRFDLAVADESLALFLQFSLERRTSRIAPVSYPVSCPRALQTILDAGNWKSGQARVRPHSRRAFGEETGKGLRAEIEDPDRALPIVLLANFPDNKPRGEYQKLIEPYNDDEWEDFINRVEDDLGGVALLVELDSASDDALLPPPSRDPVAEEPQEFAGLRIPDLPRPRLSRRRRRAMHGAVVRIIWPLGTDGFDQNRHPAWAPYELFYDDAGTFYNDDGNNTEPPGWMGTFERDQLMLLRRYIRDMVYEQAALQPVPQLIDNIRRRYVAAERERLTATGDVEILEELYREEIEERDRQIDTLQESLTRREKDWDDLRTEIGQKQATIDQLQFQLGQAKGASDTGGNAEEVAASREPATIAEAIEIAQDQCPALSFGPRATDKLDSLNPKAGPPRKVLSDLKILNQCSQLLQNGRSIGNDVIAWLKAQNVDASKESQTRLNQLTTQLTFETTRGTYEQMGDHIKYRGTGMDQQVRIHFKAQRPKDGDGDATIHVGYIGPKIEPD